MENKYKRRYRILCVCEALGGGIFSYLTELLNLLSEDFDITLAYANRFETPSDIERYVDPRIRLILMEKSRRSASVMMYPEAALEFRRIVKQIQPDVVHLHSSISGVLGRAFLNTKRIPTIYTPHFYSFLLPGLSPLKRLAFYMVEKILAQTAAVTIGVSESEYQAARKLGRRAGYINNGIRIEHEAPAPFVRRGDGELKIGTSGRILPQKSPERYAQLAQDLPHDRFVWIGDGKLRSIIEGMPNFEILGWMNRDQAVAALRQLDVMLLLSEGEGLSISLLEAMESGVLGIVSDIPANRQIIRDGVNGFIARDNQEVIRVLNRIRNGEVDVDAIRQRAYRDVVESFNLEISARRYKTLYNWAAQGDLKKRWVTPEGGMIHD